MEGAAVLFAVVVSLAVSSALGWWLCRLPRFAWASGSSTAGIAAMGLRVLIFAAVVLVLEPLLLTLWLGALDYLGLRSPGNETNLVKASLRHWA